MAGMPGVDGLPELACDRVMPVWVAEARGLDTRLGVRRFSWLASTGKAGRRLRVWWLAYSEADTAFPPHVVRHALLLSVARFFLGASAGEWDALVVREVRKGVNRRTHRGKEWFRRQAQGGGKLPPRPDGEWWRLRYHPDVGLSLYGHHPWAVEIDTGKLSFSWYTRRVHGWMVGYAGLVVVTPSPDRAQRWREWFDHALLDYPGWAGRAEVYLVRNWWTEGAVWSAI